MIFIEVSDQYVNVDQIVSVSYANETAIYLSDGRKLRTPDWPVEDVLDMIQDSIERAQQ